MNTLDIEHLVTALRQLAYGSSAFSGSNEKAPGVAIESVCDAIEKCAQPFADMGLKTSSGMMLKFLDSAQRNAAYEDWTGSQFAEKCHAVFSAIQCETIGIFCFRMENDNAPFFDKKMPFGEYVLAAFADCVEDIAEAHNCFAFERYSASAFHIGRAMERVVRAVAKKMSVHVKRDE